MDITYLLQVISSATLFLSFLILILGGGTQAKIMTVRSFSKKFRMIIKELIMMSVLLNSPLKVSDHPPDDLHMLDVVMYYTDRLLLQNQKSQSWGTG